jgi:DMSO/TMAO reductase YedYZ molybdopterin-dependent catalytic subunit
MECAGNGRHGFRPDLLGHGGPADGNQWTIGAAANGNWTGVLLRDVLKHLGLTKKAIFVAWYSEDKDCAGSNNTLISRGIDLERALNGYTMLVWSMNGEPLPAFHGFPLRLLVPGYAGGAQGKWLTRLWIRDREHDGPKMTGWAYRMPKYPIWPGTANSTTLPEDHSPPIHTEMITILHARSIITSPERCTMTANKSFVAEGRAWSGAGDVRKVELSFDHGMTWQAVDQLSKPANRFAWQKWSAAVTLPSPGAWRLMSRATDEKGRVQPLMNPFWNPKGYMNNAVMNVDITVTEPAAEVLL